MEFIFYYVTYFVWVYRLYYWWLEGDKVLDEEIKENLVFIR